MADESRHHGNQVILKFIGLFLVVLILLGGLSYLISTRPGLISLIGGLVESYGILGGIAVTFVSSLWFIVFPWELIIGPILKFHPQPLYPIVIFTITALGAHWLNFIMGRKLGQAFIHKRISDDKLEKIQGFLDKYGVYTLVFFGVIGPFTSYDVLSLVIGGFSKMRLRVFLSITLIAQFIHFLVLFLLVDVIINTALLVF